MKIITLQPSDVTDNLWASPDGELVEGTKRPYPFHVAADTGEVLRQDFWQGDPYKCVGFQNEPNVQRVNVWWDDVATTPDLAIGKYAVMVTKDGGMYTYTVAIAAVTISEGEDQ